MLQNVNIYNTARYVLYRPFCTGLKMELIAMDNIQNPHKPFKSIKTGCMSAYKYWTVKHH